MEYNISDRRLKKVVGNQRLLARQYGEYASRIQERLDLIEAVQNLKELKRLHPRLHLLRGEYEGLLSIDLDKRFRMLIRPDHDDLPTLPAGGMDFQRITQVEVVKAMENTHG